MIERKGEVETNGPHRRLPAQTAARALLDVARTQTFERVAGVEEHGLRELARDRELELDGRGEQHLAADDLAVVGARTQRLVFVTAHAVVTAGEKTHGGREIAKVGRVCRTCVRARARTTFPEAVSEAKLCDDPTASLVPRTPTSTR